MFQAIRIAVNDELSAFEDSVEQAIECEKVGGRISVITPLFGDRLCKQIFQEFENDVPEVYPLFPKAYFKLKQVKS